MAKIELKKYDEVELLVDDSLSSGTKKGDRGTITKMGPNYPFVEINGKTFSIDAKDMKLINNYPIGTRVNHTVLGTGVIISKDEWLKGRDSEPLRHPLAHSPDDLFFKCDKKYKGFFYWAVTKPYIAKILSKSTVAKPLPPNNDGLDKCCKCGAPTEKIPSALSTMDICTKCQY
jgi:hypothetical protein